MRFLALAPWQASLLAAAAAAAVVALYFLKLRHRRVLISSVLLWRRMLEEREPQSLIEKLRRLISIVIAVTIALLIALSIGRPEIQALTGSSRKIALVVDTSPTMATRTSDGRTRLERALEKARTILNASRPADEFLVADTSSGVRTALTGDRKEAVTRLQELRPSGGVARFPEIKRDEVDEIDFISDGVAIKDPPPSAKNISVFEAADNAGITAFEIRPIPSNPLAYETYLEVANYSRQPKEALVVLSGTGQQRISKRVRLAPVESMGEVFDMSAFAGGGIRATVQSPGDALEIDNAAFAYLPLRNKAHAVLVTEGNEYLETLLRLDPHVDLAVVKPAAFRESATADLYVFDRYAPQSPPSKPALLFRPPSVPWVRPSLGTVAKTEITRWNADHSIMQSVPVHDLTIRQAARIEPGETEVIAASGRTPLIVAAQKPAKWVQVAFTLEDSDFPFHLGFPIFMENVLAWFSGEQVAIRGSPGSVEVHLANARITTIDGQPVPSRQQMGKTIFDAPEPGLFTARQGETRLHIAVNSASRMFSNVNSSFLENDTMAAKLEPPWIRRELWFYMLLFAVVLIAAEWWTYHRRITL